MENEEIIKEPVKQVKIIDINKYKSSVANSPLLSGDTVEIKAYTTSFIDQGNMQAQTQTIQPPPPVTETQNIQAPPVQGTKQVIDNSGFNPFSGQSQENIGFNPPPPIEDDGIDGMLFGETKEPLARDEGDEMPVRAAEQSAQMMISMYTMMVPPIIAGMVKNDVAKFKTVLDFNKQVPEQEVLRLEKFLLTKNQEIEKALQLTKEQVVLLKQALAAVIRHYKIEPKNPVVNLLMVIIGIGVSQYLAIKQILAAQNEQLTVFIKNFGIKVPEGMENAFKGKTKIFVKKQNLQEAA